MIPAQLVREEIPSDEVELYARIDRLMLEARRKYLRVKEGHVYNVECHSVCRALCMEISDGSIKCVDGGYIGLEIDEEHNVKFSECAHSWLETRSGNIIDPYPVAVLAFSPIFMLATNATYKPFTRGHYRKDPNALRNVDMRKVWRQARVLRGMFN